MIANELMNSKEVQEYLTISESQLYKLTSKKRIPHYCPTGKKLYFRRSELDQWVFASKVKTVDETVRELESNAFANTLNERL